MRPTWNTIRNEIKRGDSVELSRFLFGINKMLEKETLKYFYLS